LVGLRGRWRRRERKGPDRFLALHRVARWLVAGGVLAGLLAATGAVGIALLMAATIARVFLEGQGLSDVMPLLVVAAALALARAVCLAAQEVLLQRASSELRQGLRRTLIDHLFELGPTWLTGERGGEVVSTVTGGLESLDAWMTQFYPARWLAVLVPGMVLLVVLVLDPPSALVLMLTGPVLILLLAYIGSRAAALTQRRFVEMRWMSAFFLDMLQGIATLKAFGRSREQADNIRSIGRQYGDTTMDVLRTAFQTALVLEWAAAVAMAVVAVEVSLRLIADAVAFEIALAVLIVTPEFFLPLRQLAIRYHAGAAGRTAAERIGAITAEASRRPVRGLAGEPLSAVPRSAVPRSAVPAASLVEGDIALEDVWFGYPGRAPVLRGLDLRIPAGSVLALTGASGAGKTTVANLLMRFIEPDHGLIRVGAMLLRDLDRATWLSTVAWVPQRPHLLWGTVADAIRVARPEATLSQVIDAARAANADAFIRGLPHGYQTHLGEGAQRLSGGQQQRLAIARAFLRDARLVVLDEPTAHLDEESEAAIADSILALARTSTVLVISHRLRWAGLADQVALLEGGRLSPTDAVAQTSRVGPAPHRPGPPMSARSDPDGVLGGP